MTTHTGHGVGGESVDYHWGVEGRPKSSRIGRTDSRTREAFRVRFDTMAETLFHMLNDPELSALVTKAGESRRVGPTDSEL